ncbi:MULTISPECIES: hypothetical protein [unclassified Acinetobacter]|uniref:hypothetical protein n=1 Tax=unclassified Acinetobacter TaxID=196816 RepID=UPI002880BE4F|nr:MULTISPECIES: hypothetical protein [unclassified Acinetobacter]MDT0198198.1 hypothetical protein [Acinetobacter sp. RG5]MDT0229662.1 hypothetical protein [Acinetobacter sp. RRD8]
MTQIKDIFKFRKSYLAMTIGFSLLPSAHAMQELSDSSLSDTTGEGVALVLDDFKMVFQGPKDLSAGSSYAREIANPGQADTGFIRIIPTGENYNQLGQRVYDKVYKSTYDNTFHVERTQNYATEYQQAFGTLKTDFYNNNYNTIKNTHDTQTNRDAFKQELVDYYYNTDFMKAYYDQRRDDYYNGAGKPALIQYSLVDDGTTMFDHSPGNLIGLDNKAKTNTLEMIDLLYGKDATKSIPSTEWSTTVDRQNIIGAIVDARILALIKADYDKKLEAALAGIMKDADSAAMAEIIARADQAAKTEAAKSSVSTLRTKADVFIYGLALSKSDGSLSTRYSNQGFSWGSADNPWLFRAGTENVKQFKDAAKDVGYIALEAPLSPIAGVESDNNIKLGFWSDIFARELNSSNAVDPITGGPISGLDTDYRLRTQFVANGLSFNGSQVRLFQTLESDNKNYSQTLGMASIVRLNTNDRPETLSSSDSNLNSKGIRLSTAAKTDALDGNVPTPALNGSDAPIFHDSEGLYLYSPNINLVLGNMYQPFVVGSEGNNIILEVTRIPNIPAIYNQIYQNYGGGLGTTDLKGSTCNVYSCGTPIKNNASDTTALYQGRNATHSSISIGTTERISGTNMLRAKDGVNSTGIVFKNTDGISKNFGSAVIDGVLIQHLKIRTTGL